MGQKLENARSLYLEGIRDGNPREAIAKYTGDRYTQHSTGVKDGQAGFIEFFEDFLARHPQREIHLVRGFEDGQHVFVHAHQVLGGGETQWVTMDFFDTDAQDRIIEHWDVIAAFSGPNPSGRTQVDGETEIRDLDRTDANKATVRAMITDLLMRGGDLTKIDAYVAEDYQQHNPEVGDGRATFASLLAAPDRKLWYDDIVLLVGRGNFVATLCRVHWGDQEYAQTDLFRLADGVIVEHWDAAEPVPAPEDLANGGKF